MKSIRFLSKPFQLRLARLWYEQKHIDAWIERMQTGKQSELHIIRMVKELYSWRLKEYWENDF